MGIDRAIDDAMRPAADFLSGIIFFTVPILGAEAPLIVFWLVAGGLFFTFYLRFINIRGFLHALAIVSGRYADRRDPGEISQFRALTTAVAGTVGIGNMAGVAVAVSVGAGPARFLAGSGRGVGDVYQVLRMHPGRAVSPRQPRRVGIGRAYVLPGGRVEATGPTQAGPGTRTLLCHCHGDWLSWDWQYVPVQPGRRNVPNHNRGGRIAFSPISPG